MSERRAEAEAALAESAAALARLIEARTHQLVIAAGDEPDLDDKVVVSRAEALARAGRTVAVLLQTLEKGRRPTPSETREDEGMNGDHAEFDALPIERKRAEIHRILDRMLAERGPAGAGSDGRRDAEAPAAILADGRQERAAAA